MTPHESNNVSVVLKYFDGCNSGDLDALVSTLDPGVVHYFLPARFPPIRGAEHLAKYWRKFKHVLDPVWRIDHIVGRDDKVVSEWSCLWTTQGTSRRVMMRGIEWYVMREGRIAEGALPSSLGAGGVVVWIAAAEPAPASDGPWRLLAWTDG